MPGQRHRGKTALAATLAQRTGAEIINADSRQFYRELPIGTAQPDATILAQAPHHFMGHLSAITEFWSAGEFMRQAQAVLAHLAAQGKLAIVCGGSGLYIQALLFGLDDVPEVPAQIRQQLKAEAAEKGLPWLQSEVHRIDPAYFAEADKQNPQRLIRALELWQATGIPYSTWRKAGLQKQAALPANVRFIALNPLREVLYERINARTIQMMQAGFLEEAQAMLPYANSPTLQTVGYRELFAYMNGQTSLPQAIALIQQNTRNYAKRQLTFLKNQVQVEWVQAVAILAEEGLPH